MNAELALQHLNEVRDVVDGNVEELVEAVARLIVLQQDISNPMYGAKVTYIAREWESEYDDEAEEREHWVTDDVEFYDPDGYPVSAHRAIVFEADVHGAGDGETEFYDPNRDEYRLPSEYPMGSVNVVTGGKGELTKVYNSKVEVHTSVVPAEDPTHPQRYSYVPGWDFDQPSLEETEPAEPPLEWVEKP